MKCKVLESSRYVFDLDPKDTNNCLVASSLILLEISFDLSLFRMRLEEFWNLVIIWWKLFHSKSLTSPSPIKSSTNIKWERWMLLVTLHPKILLASLASLNPLLRPSITKMNNGGESAQPFLSPLEMWKNDFPIHWSTLLNLLSRHKSRSS